MSMILEKIAHDYKLNDNDLYLAQYIIDHSEEVIHLSTHQLAKNTYTSATAVVRFVKKLGFINYNDFKINIHSFLSQYYLKDMEILSHESLFSIRNKLSEIEVGIINQTKNMISIDILKKVMDYISKNKYIDIIANDTNACIGEYASHLLLSTGKITTVYQNRDKQLWLSLNVDHYHTVIMISKNGKDEHLLNVADILIKRKIPFIIITSHKKNLLAKKQAVLLYGVIHDEFESLKDMVFYISLKYIFDLIYSVLISENLQQAKEVDQLYGALFDKKT